LCDCVVVVVVVMLFSALRSNELPCQTSSSWSSCFSARSGGTNCPAKRRRRGRHAFQRAPEQRVALPNVNPERMCDRKSGAKLFFVARAAA
jgi:hypothetical protein